MSSKKRAHQDIFKCEKVKEQSTALSSLNPTPAEIEYLSSYLLDKLLEDVIRGEIMELHRAAKLGYIFLDEKKPEENFEEEMLTNRADYDVFGQVAKKNQFDYDFLCPKCNRIAAASRFAYHLTVCMGHGRNSSRLANERIAANTDKAEVESEVEELDNDNNDDSDWNDRSGRKAKKKKEKATTKKLKGKKGRNAATCISDLAMTYELMSMEQKESFFSQVCGVVSENTNKICIRSVRCPQHSDFQREVVRDYELGRNYFGDTENVHASVDAVERK